MKLQPNVSIAGFTTMKIGQSKAKLFVEISDRSELTELYQYAQDHNLPVYILGEGSNSLATDQDYPGILVKNKLSGIDLIKIVGDKTTIVVQSGEIWDDFVALATSKGLTGIEALSGIPGSVGAAPIQNIGAYGQEVSQVLESIEAYDSFTKEFVTLTTDDCHFSYRDSIFKKEAKNRYFITSITFCLKTGQIQPPFYFSLDKYIKEHQITDFSPAQIRNYVLAIRSIRIPDYRIFPNSGSFFQNSLVSKIRFDEIQTKYPDLPYGEPQPDGLIKIPTAWLIEKTGLAGQTLNGILIPEINTMILNNQSANSFIDLAATRGAIMSQIRQKFQIEIQQEPIEIR